MTVRLESSGILDPFNLTLVQVYAPTNQAYAGDKLHFYEQLQDVIDQAPTGDAVLIGGDFNARLDDSSPVD
jgi:exonuclease III